MEQDTIKLVWKEMNERINSSEIASKKTLEYILKNQRRTSLQKLLVADKASFLFFLVFTLILSFLLLREDNGYWFLNIQAILLLLIATFINFLSFRKLSQINFDEPVPVLYKQVSDYKRIVAWGYIIPYILVAIFIISFNISFPMPRCVRILTTLLLPLCIVIDYLIYQWSFRQIHKLTDTTKELKELDEWLRQ